MTTALCLLINAILTIKPGISLSTLRKADRWSNKWGIGYTDANKANEIGFYPRHLSKNSRGTFISMAYAGDDYMRDGVMASW